MDPNSALKLSDLVNAEMDSAKLEMTEGGQMRVTFSDDELQSINSYLKQQLDEAHDDWTQKWNASVESVETYRTVKIPIPDGGKSVYPAPIARIPADQRIASIFNAIIRQRPIFSIDAYLNSTYSIPGSQPSQQPSMGAPAQPVPAMPVSAEQAAHTMERGYDFIMRERVQLPTKLLKAIKAAVCGQPYWFKVVVRPDLHTSIQSAVSSAPDGSGSVIDFADKYIDTSLRGDIVKWDMVPYTNCMMPLDADSPTAADWFAERDPDLQQPDDLVKRYQAKQLPLIKDEAEALSLAGQTVNKWSEFVERQKASTENSAPTNPTKVCDVWLTWFYRNVKFIDPRDPVTPDGKKNWKIKRLSLVGPFHRTMGKLLDCHLNGYEHQQRPYELVDEMEDGDCTVQRLLYHQRMFTYAAQAEIQSAHQATNLGYWYDPNVTEIAEFAAKNKSLPLGSWVPGIKDKEWGTVAFGEKHYSLQSLLQFFLSMSQLDSRENDFTMGGRPPGRTPAETTAQVYQHASETKAMFLVRLSEKLSRLLRLDAETRRQYQPLGEVLPMWDDEEKRVMELPFRFPVGDVLDNFRFALTAADEMLQKEQDPQQIMARKAALMADGEYVAKIMGAIVNLQTPLPPEGVQVFAKIINRDQAMLRELMGTVVTDEEHYDLTREIELLIAARNRALMMQQVAQQQAAQQQQALAAQQPQQPQQPPPQNMQPPQHMGGAVGGPNVASSPPQTGPVNPAQPNPSGPAAAPVRPAAGQPPVPAPAPVNPAANG